MRTFVINLDASTERRTHMTGQLAALRLPYSLFAAVEPNAGLAHFDGYDEQRFLTHTGRKATPEEIACFASHRSLWQQCVASHESIVVLEDDATLLPSFPRALAAAEELISHAGFIRLQGNGDTRHVRHKCVERRGEFALHYYASYPFGTMAYVIHPATAAAFLARSGVVTAPVDLFIKQFWAHGRPLFGLAPSPIHGSAFSTQSTISIRQKERARLRLRAARLLVKLRGALGRARFNLAFRARTGNAATPAEAYPQGSQRPAG
jgi:glycosyl transferase family 25